ncbi:hypothetical protein DFJ73DRAFT_501143 [Zopfochytrium polystomum]|nr:hypothetical protein DFJ73DRAFT_501143 [Zopfochytrium polystomum]
MVQTRSASGNAHAVPETELAVLEFQNKIVVIVTQVNKIGGQLLSLVREDNLKLDTSPLSGEVRRPSFSAHTLLGNRDDSVAHIIAMHIMDWFCGRNPNESRPLLLSLSLATGKGRQSLQVRPAESIRPVEENDGDDKFESLKEALGLITSLLVSAYSK